jgi:hypothetical protein
LVIIAPFQRQGRLHTDCAHVQIKQRFLLLPLRRVDLANAHDLAHDLRVKAGRLGLAVDFLDVGCRLGLFLLQPLNALDEALELAVGEVSCVRPCLPREEFERAPDQRFRRLARWLVIGADQGIMR